MTNHEMTADDSARAPTERGQGVERDAALTSTGRWAAGISGFSATFAGSVSVFDPSANGVPGTALILLGALFGYLGLSGQRLSRVRIGDNEASLTRVLADTIKDPKIPDEVKADIAERIEESGAVLPTLLGRELDDAILRSELSARTNRRLGGVLEQLSEGAREPRFTVGFGVAENSWMVRFDDVSGYATLTVKSGLHRDGGVLIVATAADWRGTMPCAATDPPAEPQLTALLDQAHDALLRLEMRRRPSTPSDEHPK